MANAGLVGTSTAISNCALADDGRTLYMSSHNFLAQMRVKPIGVGFQR